MFPGFAFLLLLLVLMMLVSGYAKFLFLAILIFLLSFIFLMTFLSVFLILQRLGLIGIWQEWDLEKNWLGWLKLLAWSLVVLNREFLLWGLLVVIGVLWVILGSESNCGRKNLMCERYSFKLCGGFGF